MNSLRINPLIRRFFSEAKVSLKLSLPLIVSEIIFGLQGFIGNVIAAHLGKEELAANALIWSIFITLILFFIGVLSAVCILVSHSFGAKDHHGVKIATQQGIILAAVFAIPMMLIVYFAPDILLWTGQKETIIQMSSSCFHALAISMFPLNLQIVLEQFLIGIALTRLAMIVNVVLVPLQILFSFLFAFGIFGLHRFGLAGLAVSSFVVSFLACVMMILYIQYHKSTRDYKIFQGFINFNKKYLTEIMRIGVPIGATYAIEVGLFAAIAILIGKFGADVLAAHQMTFQFFIFALTFLFGLTQGVSIRVGHKVGENDKNGLKWTVYVNMVIAFAFMLMVAIVLLHYPQKIIRFDFDVSQAKYQAIVKYAMQFLTIAVILTFCDCLRLVAVSSLRALKDTKFPLMVSTVSFWLIAFPLAYLLAFKLGVGPVGIWWGLVGGLAVAATVLNVRFVMLVKKIDLAKLVTR